MRAAEVRRRCRPTRISGAVVAVGAAVGMARSTPPGVRSSATGTCYYWLHTHAADGIIHTESPVRHIYALGEFFDIWGQPLSSSRVGPATGLVTAIYNHRVYQGDPRDIPLTRHAQIQLEIGTPLIAPETITWPNNL